MPDVLQTIWQALDVSWWQLLAAIAAVTVGGIISGLTGFGFGLVSVPVLLLLFPPASVVVLAKGLGLSSGVPILIADRKLVRVRLILTMIVPAIAGLFLGVAILRRADPAAIKLIAGAAVVFFSVLISRGWVLPGIRSKLAPLFFGFASGALGTSTGMPGPPAVMYLTHRNLTPKVFRASIVCYFFVVDIIGVTLVALTGKVGLRELWVGLVLLPFALAGRHIGQHAIGLVDQEAFRLITLRLLIATGIAAMATAILSLR
ncbi:MAG TPA: sulfite exporter TauE/SafE family protein [Thermomicrobiales bacterium]|mgnify:CR=1 FL=1|nr:sulfite exporter TauE/SafE family protein [Thermomicrobiales bacterium]